MVNEDVPAGDTGGGSGTPVGADDLTSLPERVRVHALARLIGRSSRQVLDALGRLGETVRSPQSSVPKPLAIQVAGELDALGEAAADPQPAQQPAERGESADAQPDQAKPADTEQQADPEPEPERSARRAALTPVFAAPEAAYRAPEQQRRSAPEDAEDETGAADGAADDAEDDQDAEDGSRRRRRRGRRGRGRGKGGQDEFGDGEDDESGSDVAKAADGDKPGEQGKSEKARSEKAKSDKTKSEKAKSDKGKSAKGAADKDESGKDGSEQESDGSGPAADSDTEPDDGDGGGSRRRRRRRRRKSGSDEDSTGEDDPPNTVTHVRDGKQEGGRDEVRSVRGSTRLEAKRQRRRDGRDAGRRRVPILSEAEFLARRESVDRKMVVRETGDQVQIGVLEDDVLVEHFVTSSGSGSLVGDVYLGRVQNVLPSMEAAFVDIGRGRNAVLYAGEVDWDSAGLEGKARKIEQALSTGDSVLVQVTKDPVGHKGARLTTQISLPGRFLVYVPAGGATGISRKLPDTERKRLKDILKRVVPSDAGVIVRTASEGIAEEELGADVRRLQAQWDVIKERSGQKSTKAPQLLYEEPPLLLKVVRDMFTEDFTSLVVSGGEAWQTIESYVQHVAPDLADRLKRHTTDTDVFSVYRIDEQITKALDRKVWLPSGGYLVIDRTEAMTVIDVNTGKFTGSGGNLEETVTRNNLEAAEELVRQLRLRDIGGIVVIDFIDMVLESNRDLVLRRLTECLGRDRTRHQVAEVTSLGLVQMTRKRVGTGLLEAFSQPCEHCRGRGVLVSTEPVHPHQSGGGQQGSGKKRRGGNGGENGKQGGTNQQGGSGQSGAAGKQDSQARRAVQRIAAASSTSTAPDQETAPADVDTAAADQPDETPSSTGSRGEVVDGQSAAQVESLATDAQPPVESPLDALASGNGQAADVPGVEGDDATAAVPPGTAGATRRPRRTASRPAGPPENTPV